mmetsp:Transcript_42499/g.95976  ORF Transcript_42499/g.95976 Transcript_42499/m.95976 type:complete len:227 (+) Transcript_42499:989-1669(+)
MRVVEVDAVVRQGPVLVLLGGGEVLARLHIHCSGLRVGDPFDDVDKVCRLPGNVAEVHPWRLEGKVAETATEDVVKCHLAPVHAEAGHRVLETLVLPGELVRHLDEHAFGEISRTVLVCDRQQDLEASTAPLGVLRILLCYVLRLHVKRVEPDDLIVLGKDTSCMHCLCQPLWPHVPEHLRSVWKVNAPVLSRRASVHDGLELVHLLGPATIAELGEDLPDVRRDG